MLADLCHDRFLHAYEVSCRVRAEEPGRLYAASPRGAASAPRNVGSPAPCLVRMSRVVGGMDSALPTSGPACADRATLTHNEGRLATNHGQNVILLSLSARFEHSPVA